MGRRGAGEEMGAGRGGREHRGRWGCVGGVGRGGGGGGGAGALYIASRDDPQRKRKRNIYIEFLKKV